MSDLVPNLDDLLVALPDGTKAGRDARELAQAVASADTWEDVDAALDRVVDRWASR